MERTELRCIDKTSWPPGPWKDEPDRVLWTHDEAGLTCLITRHPRRGHLCGYVAVPPGHPMHGRDAGQAGPLAVHWEITHAGPPRNDEMAVPGLEDPWWFGFHCHHAEDVIPTDPDTMFEGAEYRDIRYVTTVCVILAAQLAAIAAAHAERVAKAAFVCPRCGIPSASEQDAANGYCGNCHDFTGTEAASCPAG